MPTCTNTTGTARPARRWKSARFGSSRFMRAGDTTAAVTCDQSPVGGRGLVIASSRSRGRAAVPHPDGGSPMRPLPRLVSLPLVALLLALAPPSRADDSIGRDL